MEFQFKPVRDAEIVKEVIQDLHQFEDELKAKGMKKVFSVNVEMNKGEIKGIKTTKRRNTSEKKERIAGTDYSKWEKFDVEEAMEEVDLQEDLKRQEAAEMKEKGNALFKKGKYTESLEFYSKAIKLDPKNAVYYVNRAMANLKLENYQDVVGDCSVCLVLEAKNVKALFRRAKAYYKLEKFREAKIDLEAALQVEPKNQEVKTMLEYIIKITRRRIIPITEVNADLVKEIKENAKAVGGFQKGNFVEVQPPVVHRCFVAPKTSVDFLRDWKTLYNNENALYDYLKLIDVKLIPSLFKSSLEPVHLKSLFSVVNNISLKHDSPEEVLNFMAALSKTERFSMNLAFLTKQSREGNFSILLFLQLFRYGYYIQRTKSFF
jgi:tetratricopeptide (TPR) repeat protein